MARKTEDGKEYPAEAYLYVPDPDKPSTWKLRIWEDPEQKITVAQLGRAAAALGPGFRGNRVDLDPEDRRAAARKLIRLYREQGVKDEDIPPYLWEIAGMRKPAAQMHEDEGDDVVEREALVFEAGEYPDKGLKVTEKDIERLARNSESVPIYVEHAESPVHLGWVKQFLARGRQLWARLALHREADALLQKLGVNGLSVAVPRSLDRVLEVSVTGSPRLPQARLFNDTVLVFSFGETPPTLPTKEGQLMEQELEQLKAQVESLMQEREQFTAALEAERKYREQLEFKLQEERAKAKVDALIHTGKLPPALRDFALALGTGSQTVRFAEGKELPLFDAFVEVYSQMPPHTGAKLTATAEDEDEELKRRFAALKLNEKEIPLAIAEYKKHMGVS
jgi:hypothetical protein